MLNYHQKLRHFRECDIYSRIVNIILYAHSAYQGRTSLKYTQGCITLLACLQLNICANPKMQSDNMRVWYLHKTQPV